MIALCIPSMNRFDLLTQCIDSALAGSIAPDTIYVIDNSAGRYGERWDAAYQGRVMVHYAPENYGVAKSWNVLAMAAFGRGAHCIIANDDITFAPDTIAQLLAVAEASPRAGIVSAIAGQRFSLFWLNHAAYQDVGPFDEQFRMAYFEDNDYAWRLTLKRWQLAVAPSSVTHIGSATLAELTPEEMEAKHAAYRHNQDYFIRKWGGPPHAEIYATPFGGVSS
jgi:GT2 family glycosyltransferase